MTERTHRLQRLLFVGVGGLLLVFLAVPVASLVLGTRLADLAAGLRHPQVGPALRLSLLTTLTSLALVVSFGTPLAWVLSRQQGKLARAAEICIQLPIVMPPAVAGVALLLALGRRGALGGWLDRAGWSVSFSTTAVILAEVFVSAPFFVQAAIAAFRRLDGQLLLVARSFGAAPWRVFSRIAVPLAAPGLVAGAAMSWARSLGEFGATLMFAGNLQGETQTLPLAIYSTLESDLRGARALSVILVLVALGLLLVVRAAQRRSLDGGSELGL